MKRLELGYSDIFLSQVKRFYFVFLAVLTETLPGCNWPSFFSLRSQILTSLSCKKKRAF